MKFTVIFDTQLRVLRIPVELRSLLGFDSEASSALDWQSLVLDDASKFIPPAAGECLQTQGYLKCETGEIREASFVCERIEHGSDLICADITLANLESSSLKSAAKESWDFLATVNHELRVSLNGVIGFSNALNGTSLDSNQCALLDKLQSCNLMLKGLVDDILEYSRVANSKIKLRTETVELESFIAEVVGLFSERATQKGLELRIVDKTDSRIKAILPRLRVTQILNNLIANAIKFTDHGWVGITVSCSGGLLCIGIQDTGPGIDLSVGDSVFKPFFQRREQADSPGGSGLGLAISKELAEKMGGRLVLKRPEEGGSLFEFTLPLRESFESIPANEKSGKGNAQVEVVRAGSKRVLMVEDNQLNADILGHFLQDYGVAYDHVDNGRAAVEVYQDGKYDLILMDVMLPEMNGYEATEKILAQTRLTPPVPIVGVTAKVFRRDQIRCIEAGMVEVVHKPVDFNQLRAVLDLHLYSGGSEAARVSAKPISTGEDLRAVSARIDGDVAANAIAGKGRGCMNAGTLESYIDRMKTPDTSRLEIVNTAIVIVDAEVEGLVHSIEKGDRKDIGMRAHSLKGALALLGARNILDLAKGLELIASDGRAPLKATHWKNMIEGSYAEFRSQLEAYMQTTLVD